MSAEGEIRASPQEEGLYFLEGQSWQVGKRYKLQKLLGSGSFSAVCLATDTETGEQVALKRIANVLQSPDNAKKVLREVCILRRLSHPNVIGLKNAFVRPSTTGPWKLLNGQLAPASIDVYLALEYCGGGDLFGLRGQLRDNEVRDLMWQLLRAVRYCHSQSVWHRDIKSANVLLTVKDGVRIIKLGDFGSARSAWSPNGHPEATGIYPTSKHMLHSSMSMDSMPDSSFSLTPSSERQELQETTGIPCPLTRTVSTPCYRAPEVVMSRGGYTSALDMWSLGCIFGELLQRIARVGSADTPQLKIAPLFAIHGLPKTPSDGDHYMDGPGNIQTRRELQALFDVIGTPTWSCIERVQSQKWRNYLRNLPLRAGTLHRRFWFAGEPAVDLLTRLLTFDPSRRCRAEEAMMHELFFVFWDIPLEEYDFDKETGDKESQDEEVTLQMEDMAIEPDSPAAFENPPVDEEPSAPQAKRNRTLSTPPPAPPSPRYYEILDPAKALAALETEMLDICTSDDGCEKLRVLLETEIQGVEKGSDETHIQEHLVGSPFQDRHQSQARRSWQHLKPDPGFDGTIDPEAMGPERLQNVADCHKAQLDPQKHLAVGRHGEWTETSGCGPGPGRAWGVSTVPPGLDEKTLDPLVRSVVLSQQMR